MKKTIDWCLDTVRAASSSGANNGSKNAFSAEDMKSFVRESAQNSLDAGTGNGPVMVEYNMFDLDSDSHVCKRLTKIGAGARKFWTDPSREGQNENELALLDAFDACLKNKKIGVLAARDFNTTGLVGSQDDTNKWNSLINMRGNTRKRRDASRGSQGQGKYAAFYYTALRTVFYHTLAVDGGRAIEGVYRGVTSIIDGQRKSEEGKYLVEYEDGTIAPITPDCKSNLFDLPFFSRKENEYGTDVAVIGFDFKKYNTWVDDTIVEIIKNFLPALYNNEFIVKVKDKKIDSTNLKDYLLDERYYNDLKSQVRIFTALEKKKFASFSIADENDLIVCWDYNPELDDSYVCVFRQGMAIEKGLSISIPDGFTVLVFVDPHGNNDLFETLKASEDISHREWETRYIADTEIDTIAPKLKVYKDKIVQCILRLCDENDMKPDSEVQDSGIGDLLPLDGKFEGNRLVDFSDRENVFVKKISIPDLRIEIQKEGVGDQTEDSEKQKRGKKKKKDKNVKPVPKPLPLQSKNLLRWYKPDGTLSDPHVVLTVESANLSSCSRSLSVHEDRDFSLQMLISYSETEMDGIFYEFEACRDKDDDRNTQKKTYEVLYCEDADGNRCPVTENRNLLGPVSLKAGRNVFKVKLQKDSVPYPVVLNVLEGRIY